MDRPLHEDRTRHGPGTERQILILKEPHPAAELDAITQRERQVMTLAADGLTNDEIARKPYMSPATARTHVSRTMTKPGVRDRAQLVVLASETGLVRPKWLS